MSDNRNGGGYRNDSRRGSGYGRQEQYGQPQYGAQEQYDQYGQFGERRQGGQYAQYGQQPRRDTRQQYDRQPRSDAPQYGQQPRRDNAPQYGQQPRYDRRDAYSRERYSTAAAYAPEDGFDDDFEDMPEQPRQRVAQGAPQRVPQGAQQRTAQGAPQRAPQGAPQRPAQRTAQGTQRPSASLAGRQSAAQGRYKKTAMDSISEGLNNALQWCKKNPKQCIIVGSVALACVLLVVLLCIGLGDGCGGGRIPSVEQGDLENEFIYGETISGGDGQIIINEEGGSVDSFTVDVTDANGSFRREDGAELTISGQDSTGFYYELNVGGKTCSGYAYFIGATSALQELEEGVVTFDLSEDGVQLSQNGAIAALEGASASGKYSGTVAMNRQAPPEEEGQGEEDSPKSEYNADVRTTKAVTDALAAALSAEEERLVELIFSSGTCPVFQNPERVLDKNGKECMVDGEMGAVKYYAFIQGTGEELLLICKDDGTFWLGLCNGCSYRYFTNDSERRDKAPEAIVGQATAKSMTLTY